MAFDTMSESQSLGREAVRQMSEFGITGDGELDLGLSQPARPAGGPPRARTTAAAAAGAAAPPAGDVSCDDWIDSGWEPGDYDPESEPDDFEGWLAGLPAGVRADFLAGPWTGAGESIPAGFLHHDRHGPAGAGFSAGGVLDGMAPGAYLPRPASPPTTSPCAAG